MDGLLTRCCLCPAKGRSRWWATGLLLLLVVTVAEAQQPLTAGARAVNRKLVKLYGIGGYRGLPAYGTGILISPQGHILTVNNHLLNTPDIIVHTYDGRQYRAQALAREPELDAAVLRIEDKVDNLPYFDLATAAARPMAQVGDWVLAVSNAFNIATRDEPLSVQHGVIAAVTELRGRRGVFEAPYAGPVYFIDTVANNPGSAGGALTTRRGELLGILGREVKNTLSDTWINYAIPVQARATIIRDGKPLTIDLVTFVREALQGKYRPSEEKKLALARPGYHGIILVPNVLTTTPPYVEDVIPDSPAAKAGLRPDDLILYVDGELVPSIKKLQDILRASPPGSELRLEVQRHNQLLTLTLKLTEPPQK
jgi:S1-C subfamily serine protease